MKRYLRTLSCLLPIVLLSCAVVACTDEAEQVEPLEDLPNDETVFGSNAEALRLHAMWDANQDTYLTPDEFAAGVATAPRWEDWDTDGDGYLSEEEFEVAFRSYDWYTPTYYGDWDQNGDARLSADEWATGVYVVWDGDGNQRLSSAEWEAEAFD